MIKLRTKIEAFACVVSVSLVVISSLTALRVMEDTRDTFFARVSNGNGEIFNLTNAGIQEAVWSCDNKSNIVHVTANDGTSITITSTIVLGENVILDLGGVTLKPAIGVNCIKMQDGAEVYGGNIDLSNYATNDSTHSAFEFDGADTFNYDKTSVHDMIISGGSGTATKGIGIHVHSDGSSSLTQYTMWLKFNTITLNNLYYGIYIISDNGVPSHHHFNNGHMYSDIHIMGCQYGVYLKGEQNISNSCQGHQFTSITFEQARYGKSFVYCNASFNSFSIACFDWNNSGYQTGYASFTFGTNASQNILRWNSLREDYLGIWFYRDLSANDYNFIIGSYTGYAVLNSIRTSNGTASNTLNLNNGQAKAITMFYQAPRTIAPSLLYIYGNGSKGVADKRLTIGHSWSNGAQDIQSTISNNYNMRLRVDASGDQYTTGKNVSLFGQYGITIGARSDSTGSSSGKTTGSVSIPLLKLGLNTTVPVIANPETGMIRFCSNNNTLAVYSGSRWYFYAPIT